MNISWDDARIFLAICETENFSAAARELGLTQPTVSRRIAALEARLGTALFVRSRLGVEPTREALELIGAAREMHRWAAEFGRIAQGRATEERGPVRIAAPPGVAVEQLAPFAAVLARSHPAIRLVVLAGVEHIDLVRGGADLALRTRAPQEPELIALAHARIELGVYASRAYARMLAERLDGKPAWRDLDWITWAGSRAQVSPRPMLERVVPDFTPAFESDDYLVQKEALRQGLGAMILAAPDPASADARELVRIPMDVSLPNAEFHLVCARSARYIPRVRRVAALLMERISALAG